MKFSKLSTYKARKILTMFSKDIYPNNLKNWFSTASALPQNDCPCSCLASRQWSLAPDKNFEEPPGQIPNFSSCLGINASTAAELLRLNRNTINRHYNLL